MVAHFASRPLLDHHDLNRRARQCALAASTRRSRPTHRDSRTRAPGARRPPPHRADLSWAVPASLCPTFAAVAEESLSHRPRRNLAARPAEPATRYVFAPCRQIQRLSTAASPVMSAHARQPETPRAARQTFADPDAPGVLMMSSPHFASGVIDRLRDALPLPARRPLDRTRINFRDRRGRSSFENATTAPPSRQRPPRFGDPSSRQDEQI